LFNDNTRGNVTDVASTTKWHLTNQAYPNTALRKILRRACDIFSTSGVLHIALKVWLYPAVAQQRQWKFYYDPDLDMLFHQVLV
jgi:hypothetical protein